MSYYVGILDGAKKVWGVRLPDFPGCHGGGATPDAAIADVTGALREYAALMFADGEQIPVPRDMAAIVRDRDAEYDPARESLVMIPLLLDKGRPVKANISLDAGLLEAIDEEAARRGLTRSAFLVSAAIDKIEGAGIGGGKFAGRPYEAGHGIAGFAEAASAQVPLRRPRKAKRR
jgi:predicted RNase H-like HicB family nuclease